MRSPLDRNKLILKYPASWWRNMWREGLPSGNGKIGASVYGGISQETILINHEDLWHMGYKDVLPDVSHTLAETRELMEERKYHEANWHLTKALTKHGYKTKLASVLPLVDLKVTMQPNAGFKNYQRILDMETGEVTVEWEEENQTFQRQLFVSRADDAVIYRIDSDREFSVAVELDSHPSDQPQMADRLQELAATTEIQLNEQFICFARTNDDETDFGAVLRLVPEGGKIEYDGTKIRCHRSKQILIMLKVFVKGDRKRDWNRLKTQLMQLNPSYPGLLAKHVKLHSKLFHSASVELDDVKSAHTSNEQLLLAAYAGETPTELVEKMWRYGRYLFISGTRVGGQPFSMYGLWAGDYQLMWPHRMANENIQMMYWHTNVGGLSTHNHTLFDYYQSMLDDFQDNAQKLYGCRGIYIPAGTTPGIGVPNQIVPVIMNWTNAAGWLAQHYYNHYLYTGDEVFLKTIALPFLKEVAQFYEDFVVIGEDGFYQYYPSVSPENTPSNFMPKNKEHLNHPMPTTINATMDIAIMKEVLQNLIAGSKVVGENLQLIDKWDKMLASIPFYQINEAGAIQEWMHPDFEERYDHRHLSHIYPIFPGHEFTVEENPEIFRAFGKAVEKRELGAQTGWSLAHMANIYACLGDGNQALACLNHLARSCLLVNFFTLHNDWRDMGMSMDIETAPVQLDANLGWVNAVQEMLLYSSPQIVKILPALPEKWTKGKVRDFRFCAGRVSFEWDIDQYKFSCELYAEREIDFTLKLPSFVHSYQFSGVKVQGGHRSLGENYYRLLMSPGEKVMINSHYHKD